MRKEDLFEVARQFLFKIVQRQNLHEDGLHQATLFEFKIVLRIVSSIMFRGVNDVKRFLHGVVPLQNK